MTAQTRVLETGTVPSWLSVDPFKRTVYQDDLYFWDGWSAFLTACSGEPGEAVLRHRTFVMIKPEAIVGRRVDPILDFLEARGFTTTGIWPVRLGRHAVRALWGYQINSTPVAWVRSLELGISAGELFVVGLTHPLEHGEASSAAEMLRLCKGTTSRPGGDSLRDELKCPARMVSFIHAPDEAADVIRELSILCGGVSSSPEGPVTGLEEVVAAFLGLDGAQAGRPAARAVMTARYSQAVPHDLDVDATFQRMHGYLRDGFQPGGLPPETWTAVEQRWVEPEQALRVVISLERAHALPLWDRIVTVACLTDSLRNGRPMLITPPV